MANKKKAARKAPNNDPPPQSESKNPQTEMSLTSLMIPFLATVTEMTPPSPCPIPHSIPPLQSRFMYDMATYSLLYLNNAESLDAQEGHLTEQQKIFFQTVTATVHTTVERIKDADIEPQHAKAQLPTPLPVANTPDQSTADSPSQSAIITTFPSLQDTNTVPNTTGIIYIDGVPFPDGLPPSLYSLGAITILLANFADLTTRVSLVLQRDHVKQKDLAKVIGVSSSTLSPLLRGKYKHTNRSHIVKLKEWLFERERSFVTSVLAVCCIKGLNQEKLGQIAQISHTTISEWIQLQLPISHREAIDHLILQEMYAITSRVVHGLLGGPLLPISEDGNLSNTTSQEHHSSLTLFPNETTTAANITAVTSNFNIPKQDEPITVANPQALQGLVDVLGLNDDLNYGSVQGVGVTAALLLENGLASIPALGSSGRDKNINESNVVRQSSRLMSSRDKTNSSNTESSSEHHSLTEYQPPIPHSYMGGKSKKKRDEERDNRNTDLVPYVYNRNGGGKRNTGKKRTNTNDFEEQNYIDLEEKNAQLEQNNTPTNNDYYYRQNTYQPYQHDTYPNQNLMRSGSNPTAQQSFTAPFSSPQPVNMALMASVNPHMAVTGNISGYNNNIQIAQNQPNSVLFNSVGALPVPSTPNPVVNMQNPSQQTQQPQQQQQQPQQNPIFTSNNYNLAPSKPVPQQTNMRPMVPPQPPNLSTNATNIKSQALAFLDFFDPNSPFASVPAPPSHILTNNTITNTATRTAQQQQQQQIINTALSTTQAIMANTSLSHPHTALGGLMASRGTGTILFSPQQNNTIQNQAQNANAQNQPHSQQHILLQSAQYPVQSAPFQSSTFFATNNNNNNNTVTPNNNSSNNTSVTIQNSTDSHNNTHLQHSTNTSGLNTGTATPQPDQYMNLSMVNQKMQQILTNTNNAVTNDQNLGVLSRSGNHGTNARNVFPQQGQNRGVGTFSQHFIHVDNEPSLNTSLGMSKRMMNNLNTATMMNFQSGIAIQNANNNDNLRMVQLQQSQRKQ